MSLRGMMYIHKYSRYQWKWKLWV